MDTKSVRSAQLPKKTGPEEYDLVVLGSGTGAKVAAWTTAEQGKRVALIERKYIGGSCHNIACLPSKNIFHSAKVASYVNDVFTGQTGDVVARPSDVFALD